MTMRIQAILIIVFLTVIYCKNSALKETFYWGVPDFKFPNASAREQALSSESYIPENNVVYSVGAWKDKIFVSVFRFKVGVVSALNYFSANCATKSPVLIPYPSYDANYVNEDPDHQTVSLPSKSSIINAAFFRIDYKCDRLWILDSGFVLFFGTRRIISEPAVVIFDLNTNKVIRRYEIPAEFINSESSLVNLAIDIKDNCCNDAYVYIPDLFRSIIVYSFKKNRSWRLTHNYFGSDPDKANLIFDGVNLPWNYGVGGVTVGDHHKDGSRRVYINPISSTKTYYISNKILQNETHIASNSYFYDVRLLGERGRDIRIFEFAYDEQTNVLFDSEYNKKIIGCWNASKRYKKPNFDIVLRGKKLFFSVVINIDGDRNLWVVSNNYVHFVFGAWDPKAINMRIYKGKVDDIISGTVCEK